MGKAITDRQREVLQWMTAYQQANQRPPTVAEIAARFGIKRQSVYNILRSLITKGYLGKGDGSSRSIRPTDLARASDAGIDPRLMHEAPASDSIAGVNGFSGSILVGRVLGLDKLLFLVTVKGDSMIEAQIADGDLAVVRVQNAYEDQDIVVASVKGQACIRRIAFDDDGSAILTPENRKQASVRACAGEFVIYGKVVAIYREMA